MGVESANTGNGHSQSCCYRLSTACTVHQGLNLKPKGKRLHGLHRTWTTMQVISYFYVPTFYAHFYALLYPALPRVASIVLVTIYTILALTLIISMIRASAINPEDTSEDCQDPSMLAQVQRCNVCQKTVQKSTKHCRKCGKCVEKFDHHCETLNNCIGKKNYPSFFVAVVSCTVLSFLQLAITVYVIVMFGRYRSELYANLDKWYGCTGTQKLEFRCPDGSLGFAPAAYITLVCSGIFLLVPPAMAALEVLLFHIYLIRHRITTYEYLSDQHKKRIAKEKAADKTRRDIQRAQDSQGGGAGQGQNSSSRCFGVGSKKNPTQVNTPIAGSASQPPRSTRSTGRKWEGGR